MSGLQAHRPSVCLRPFCVHIEHSWQHQYSATIVYFQTRGQKLVVCRLVSLILTYTSLIEKRYILLLASHSSEIRGLCLMKCPRKMLQNLAYCIWNTKSIYLVSFSYYVYIIFSPDLIGASTDH